MIYIKYLIKRLFYWIFRLLITKKPFSSFYFSIAHENQPNSVDSNFTTVDGSSIPVYNDYRSSVKNWWLMYECVVVFSHLVENSLTTRSEALYFKHSVGKRTLGYDPNEIEENVKEIIRREKSNNLFFGETLNQQYLPKIIPSNKEIKLNINHTIAHHKNLLFSLKTLGVFSPQKDSKLLEIGFESGGHSLFAFENLGFSSTGLDNRYGGLDDECFLPNYIKNKISSEVNFCYGDITEKTKFDNDSFDVIYSASVLEHIQNLPAAFNEMRRLLKPGGVMIHGYNPFFCPNGGHALGILDSPWAHVRMNQEDHLRYMDELRPFEAERSKKWVVEGLNPVPAHEMQLYLSQAQFNIRYWLETPASPELLRGQSPEIILDCFKQYPGITLNDLSAQRIFFVALNVK